jgi:hypothetical protein
MRSTLWIERLAPSYRTIMVGAEATTLLSNIDGISDLRVDVQRIDCALISCQATGPLKFAQIDDALATRGMHRI